MQAKMLVIATILGASACVADDSAAVSEDVARPLSQSAQLDIEAPLEADADGESSDDGCTAIADTGACTLACDNDALIERFVPENTCALFDCMLADGSEIRVGGCN